MGKRKFSSMFSVTLALVGHNSSPLGEPFDHVPSISVGEFRVDRITNVSYGTSRFLPNGTVLSLLANNDQPSEVVHVLKPSYRGQASVFFFSEKPC